ncbi:MAG: 50S ribosomal protein L31e [Candidatus Woesearchaeota archaeon]
MAKKEETKVTLERNYNIPLRQKFMQAPHNKRAKKATAAVKEFLKKHMKSDDVRIGEELNNKIWERGIRKPPHHIKVKAQKYNTGVVLAELEGVEEKKKPAKKQEKKAEPVTEEKKEEPEEKETEETKEKKAEPETEEKKVTEEPLKEEKKETEETKEEKTEPETEEKKVTEEPVKEEKKETEEPVKEEKKETEEPLKEEKQETEEKAEKTN